MHDLSDWSAAERRARWGCQAVTFRYIRLTSRRTRHNLAATVPCLALFVIFPTVGLMDAVSVISRSPLVARPRSQAVGPKDRRAKVGAGRAASGQSGAAPPGRTEPGSHLQSQLAGPPVKRTAASATAGRPRGLRVAPGHRAVTGRAAARAAIRAAPDTPGPASVAGVANTARPTAAARSAGAAGSARSAGATMASASREPAVASDERPWYAKARSGRAELGLRDCGCLEQYCTGSGSRTRCPAGDRHCHQPASGFAAADQGEARGRAGGDLRRAGRVPDLDHMGGSKAYRCRRAGRPGMPVPGRTGTGR